MIKQQNKIKLLFIFAIAVQALTSLSALFIFKFRQPINEKLVLISNIDFLLSVLTIYPLLIKNLFFLSRLSNLMISQGRLKRILNKGFPILVVICLFTGYKAFQSLSLILQGYGRGDLIYTFQVTDLSFFVCSAVFKIVFPFSLVFMPMGKVFYVSLIGIISVSMIGASRSELLYVLFMYLTIILISNKKINYSFLVILPLGAIFLSSLITQHLQLRVIDTDNYFGLLDIVNTFSRYRVFAYYLAERAIDISQSLDKILFPFFGYLSEKIMIDLNIASNPVDTEFLTYLVNLSTSEQQGYANVLYPWWGWFYGVYGLIGLIYKCVYQVIILKILIRVKASMTFVYVLCNILFLAPIKHPLLFLGDWIILLIVLSIDILSRFKQFDGFSKPINSV